MISEADLAALAITLKLAFVSTLVLLLLGTPLAWWLSRTRWRFKFVPEAIVALPLVLPPTVLGFYLLLALSPSGPVGALTDALTDDGFYVTQVDSSGGILYEATVTLLIGLDRAFLPRLLERIRECCRTRQRFVPAHVEAPLLEIQPVMIEAEVGGATVYTLDVERFEQL